jgi:hypothetical protein
LFSGRIFMNFIFAENDLPRIVHEIWYNRQKYPDD